MSKGFRVLTRSRSLKVTREIVFLDTKENWNENCEEKQNDSILVDFIEEEEEKNLQEQVNESDDDLFEQAESEGDDAEEEPNAEGSSETSGNIEIIHLSDSDTSDLIGFDDDLNPVSSNRRQSTESDSTRGSTSRTSDSSAERNVIENVRPVRLTRGKEPPRYNPVTGKSYAVRENVVEKDPRSYKEALASSEKFEGIKAMKEELMSIEQNGTWMLTTLPRNRVPVGSKWVFKRKLDDKGQVVRYKARLVATGYNQKFGVDYDEVFAPVARSTTMRLLLSIAGMRNYVANQYDIKTAFLNGELEEEIYLRPPESLSTKEKSVRTQAGGASVESDFAQSSDGTRVRAEQSR